MRICRTRYHTWEDGCLVHWCANLEEGNSFLTDLKRNRGDDHVQEPINVEMIEIPTDKAGLIRWLNVNVNTDNG